MAIAELEGLLQEPQLDLYEDPKGYVDDIPEEGTHFIKANSLTIGRMNLELLADVLAKEPTPQVYEERCLIVFGIPIAPEAKLPKLRTILNKFFTIQDYTYFDHIPLDEQKMTKVCLQTMILKIFHHFTRASCF